jgi:hypothetical protein
LSREAVLERRTDRAMESAQLTPVEAGRLAKRIEARPPERLVGVDVPHSGERALVEERCLQGRAATRQALAEPGRREQGIERLVADTGGDVRLRLPRLEQEPRSEAPDVSVRDIRSVV